jgi:DNA-binding NtrC family response regulator
MWSSSCSASKSTRHLLRDAASSSTDAVSRHTVLIFSPDALAVALLAGAVELAGYTPRFANAGEPARAALRRTRPDVTLIDCDHSEGCADSFIGPALMTGSRVILFRSPHSGRDIAEFAERLSLTVIDMPVDSERLRQLLDADPRPAS